MKKIGKSAKTKLLFALTLASLLFASTVQRYFSHSKELRDADFYVYYFAAQMVHEHPRADLYYGATEGNPQLRSAPADSELLRKARAGGHDGVEMYLYPPMLADLLAPVSNLPPAVAASLWRILNLGLVLASVLALARMLDVPLLSSEFVVLAVAAYAFLPIVEATPIGQATIVMLALWTVGVVAYAEERVLLSAVVLALATSLKVTPVLLVPLFFIWKDKRWLLAYSASLASLVFLMGAVNGWHNLVVYGHVMSAMGGSVPTSLNRCISSLIAWIYYGRFVDPPAAGGALPDAPRLLSLASKAASLGFYLVGLFLLWRQRPMSSYTSRATMVAVFALVALLVSPVSWRHGYTVAFLPLAILWAQALRTALGGVRPLLLAATTISIGTIILDLAVQAPLPEPVRILCAAAWTITSLLLCLEVLSQRFPADSISGA